MERVNGAETETQLRVRYAETDQMGFAHHANYLIWCELARTNHMRDLGVPYRDLETAGIRLPVVEARVRYRAPARYDDLLRIRCWVRDVRSRQVVFGYAVVESSSGRLLATAETALLAIDRTDAPTTIPETIRERLVTAPDPVRL